MNHGISWKVVAAAALMMVSASPVMAQYYSEYGDGKDSLRSHLRSLFKEEMGRTVVGFWEPRLNAYKVRIDGMFSGDHLEQLNELRVRFGILMEQMIREDQERSASIRAQEFTTDSVAVEDVVVSKASTIDTAAPSDEEILIARMEDLDSAQAARLMEEYEQQQAEEMRQREETWAEQREAARERELAEAEKALERGEQVQDRLAPMERYQDFMELPAVAKWLARNYRAQLDNLADVTLNDLAQFADTLDRFIVRFKGAHSGELAQVPDVERSLDSDCDVKEIRSMLRHPLYCRKMYTTRLEQYVLLYNGEGIAKLIGSVSGSSVASDLPETSLLGQNTPNPASNSTTITYTLPEASSQVYLSFYNSRGETVMELNQGPKDAGVYRVQVDISDLPSGWYLYKLTSQGSQGERVSSKAMQIVQ